MSIQPLDSIFPPADLPHHVEVLLHETSDSLENWERTRPHHSFIPADYVLLYDALHMLRRKMPPTPRFMEWGSGLGIVAMLAASLGWRAEGIEIERGLVNESRHFSKLFDLPILIHEASFFPKDPNVFEQLEEACAKCDLIYVYPWPDQEVEIFDLFDQLAKPGSHLLTYYGVEDVRIFQKI